MYEKLLIKRIQSHLCARVQTIASETLAINL